MKKARRTVRKKDTSDDADTLVIILHYKSGKVLGVHRRFADGIEEDCEWVQAPAFTQPDYEEVGPQELMKLRYYKSNKKDPNKNGNCIRWVGNYCVLKDRGVKCS